MRTSFEFTNQQRLRLEFIKANQIEESSIVSEKFMDGDIAFMTIITQEAYGIKIHKLTVFKDLEVVETDVKSLSTGDILSICELYKDW